MEAAGFRKRVSRAQPHPIVSGGRQARPDVAGGRTLSARGNTVWNRGLLETKTWIWATSALPQLSTFFRPVTISEGTQQTG